MGAVGIREAWALPDGASTIGDSTYLKKKKSKRPHQVTQPWCNSARWAGGPVLQEDTEAEPSWGPCGWCLGSHSDGHLPLGQARHWEGLAVGRITCPRRTSSPHFYLSLSPCGPALSYPHPGSLLNPGGLAVALGPGRGGCTLSSACGGWERPSLFTPRLHCPSLQLTRTHYVETVMHL